MTPTELDELESPEGLSLDLQALWHEQRGDWNRAHELAQEAASREGDWVHAYLHRKEGDVGNAGYWYVRAGQPISNVGLATERALIVANLLKRKR